MEPDVLILDSKKNMQVYVDEFVNKPEEIPATSGYAQVIEEPDTNAWGDYKELPLLFIGEPILAKRPEAFDFETEGDKAADLAVLLKNKMVLLNGIGLSANQIGIDRRVFVMGSAREFQVIFNPSIIGVSKETICMSEACLSIPHLVLNLVRPKAVTISFQDVEGKTFVATYDGLTARVIQHEFDHMEGYNFTQLASPFKVQHEINKLRNRAKKGERYIKRLQKQGKHIAEKQAKLAPLRKSRPT